MNKFYLRMWNEIYFENVTSFSFKIFHWIFPPEFWKDSRGECLFSRPFKGKGFNGCEKDRKSHREKEVKKLFKSADKWRGTFFRAFGK